MSLFLSVVAALLILIALAIVTIPSVVLLWFGMALDAVLIAIHDIFHKKDPNSKE